MCSALSAVRRRGACIVTSLLIPCARMLTRPGQGSRECAHPVAVFTHRVCAVQDIPHRSPGRAAVSACRASGTGRADRKCERSGSDCRFLSAHHTHMPRTGGLARCITGTQRSEAHASTAGSDICGSPPPPAVDPGSGAYPILRLNAGRLAHAWLTLQQRRCIIANDNH
jgi:hypothetical protein